MLFNSFEFLLFLPVVFLLYWKVFYRLRVQNLFVVAASYLFYGWWNWRFLLLIALTTVCSYASGLLLERFDGRDGLRKLVSISNIVLNLGVLCIYKYFDFFSASLSAMMAALGIGLDKVTLDLILPVGISFYTFQALSYTIDVYRGKIAPTHDVPAFFAYISFFPQLVAGPIELATNLLPQFLGPRRFDYGQAVEGMRQILWGLFKKIVVADNCAEVVNYVFDGYQSIDGGMLVWGGVFFAFQIYGDFSGYSDIAIGTARLFGIRLMRNFNFPYLSRDIAEFWRRWHISLNTWFIDYIYIPLGGSRRGTAIAIRNVLVIFLLSGLWHGADWTFVGWGAFNALLFIPLLIAGKNRTHSSGVVAAGRVTPTLLELLQIAVTFAFVTVGWIIFRSDTVSQAWGYIYRMFAEFEPVLPLMYKKALVSVAILMAVEWLQREREFGLQFPDKGLFRHKVVRWVVYYMVFLLILVWSHSPEDFIYFQF